MQSKEKPFYKKWWILIVVIIIIAIPFIINKVYKMNTGYVTMWDAADVLAFYGSLLSFAGTITLGVLVLLQNIKANSINERLSLLEKERFKIELQPFVIVTNWKIEVNEFYEVIQSPKKLYIQIEKNEFKDNEFLCLSLFFTNTSNSYTIVNYLNAKVFHNDTYIEDWGNATSNQQNTKIYLQSGDTGEIVFYCSEEKMSSFSGKKIKLELILENRFSETYRETFDIVVPVLAKYRNNTWYVSVNPQNYQIRKFIRGKNGEIVLEEDND